MLLILTGCSLTNPPSVDPTPVDTEVSDPIPDKTACTKADKPVCAMVEIQCITTPCNPILETFENHCLAEERNSVIDFVDGKCETQLDSTCEQDSDCLTPGEYAMRSSCPFAAKCLNQQCIVVCPDF